MPVSTPVVYEWDVNNSVTGSTSPVTVAPISGGNRLALLIASWERAAGGVAGPMFLSMSWSGVSAAEVWRGQQPAEPSTVFRGGIAIFVIEEVDYPETEGTITYTHESLSNDVHCALVQVSGTLQGDLTRLAAEMAAQATGSNSSSIAHTLTTGADNALAMQAIAYGENRSITWDSGQTQMAEGLDSEFTAFHAYRALGAAGSHAMDATLTTGSSSAVAMRTAWHLLPVTGYSLAIGSGTFAVLSEGAGLRVTRRLPMATGSVALSGQATGLFRNRRLLLATGAYAVSGGAVALRVSDGTISQLLCPDPTVRARYTPSVTVGGTLVALVDSEQRYHPTITLLARLDS